MIVETEARREIIEVAVDGRSVHPVLSGDEEPPSRIEIRDAVVLVVWVAREFVAHAQRQRQVVSGAPGIDEVPTQHVSEQLPGGIAADGLAADGKTEQEIGERSSRGA